MRKLFLFLGGLLLLASMLGLLFFAGAIYDAEQKHKIETFFFETNAESGGRVATPIAADDMSPISLRDSLIARFINEYFYVIPDDWNAAARAECLNTDNTLTALCGLATASVSKNWKNTMAPEIKEMADAGAMRQVKVLSVSEAESGHLVVGYQLTTWNEPNNVLARPIVTVGNLYLDVTHEPVRANQTQDVLNQLSAGVDPAYAFADSFRILDVLQQ